MSDPRLDELTEQLSPGALTTDADVLETYRQDVSRDPNAGTPAAVIRAKSEEDVIAVLTHASKYNIPVVPRGAGSSVVGGSTAVDGALTLSVEKLNSIAVDSETMTAVVGPGAINAQVSAAAAKEGLFYAPDPTSSDVCSVGGNVSTNSGGPAGFKYGITRDFVVALRVVLASGKVVELGGQGMKASHGLSLKDLVIGAEGTLGVVTQITLRLLPAPATRHTVAGFFEDPMAAIAAATDIARRLRPADMAVMDRPALEVAEEHLHMGLEESTGAVLFAYTDSGDAAAADVAMMEKICNDHGAQEVFSTDDRSESEMISAPRHAMFEALEGRFAMMVEDYVLPLNRLAAFLKKIHEVSEQTGQRFLTYLYPADGVVHPVIPFDPSDGDAAAKAIGARAQLTQAAREFGGAIAGEYGVGSGKREALAEQLGEDVLELQRQIRAVFDPQGILNPRVLIEPTE